MHNFRELFRYFPPIIFFTRVIWLFFGRVLIGSHTGRTGSDIPKVEYVSGKVSLFIEI